MALFVAGGSVELREVVLRDKPEAFLAASPSQTVPCLVTRTQTLDESLEIMIWALKQSDPQAWLDMPDEGWDLITLFDSAFKTALDRTKYATRYPQEDAAFHRLEAERILAALEHSMKDWVFETASLADFAILPFVRQFAFIDKATFDAAPWPKIHAWLDRFLASSEFDAIMPKFDQWVNGDDPVYFPARPANRTST